ncbi:MAG: hypothetical protein IJV36_05720 [Prevotella sp.]|nr:hypothetical protein [Prevotella sp.]
MTRLTPNNGIPRRILMMMAVLAGFTVANLYYNQPLLDMICRETGMSVAALYYDLAGAHSPENKTRHWTNNSLL